MSIVIARVVGKRDEPRLALATTAASALGLAAVVVDDLLRTPLFRPSDLGVYGGVAVLISLGGLGPWLAWHRRGRTTSVTCEPGLVRAGDLTIHAEEVTALRIAVARRGRSVAIARGSSVVFIEVERADDARRIADALSMPVTPFGELPLRQPARWGMVLQLLVAVFAVACGPLYYLATRGLDGPFGFSGKAVFGIGGVAAAWVQRARWRRPRRRRGPSPCPFAWRTWAAATTGSLPGWRASTRFPPGPTPTAATR